MATLLVLGLVSCGAEKVAGADSAAGTCDSVGDTAGVDSATACGRLCVTLLGDSAASWCEDAVASWGGWSGGCEDCWVRIGRIGLGTCQQCEFGFTDDAIAECNADGGAPEETRAACYAACEANGVWY